MTGDDEKSPVKVALEASVKAELKTEIPADSSGRLLDALTDIIRPFSEGRGLRADQIRLQREDVLIEIAKKAQQRLEAKGVKPKPISNKFMVSFLEKASCEDMQSLLLENWATLLAGAAQTFDPVQIRCIDILSQISAVEAELLRDLCAHNLTTAWSNSKLTYPSIAPIGYMEERVVSFIEDGLKVGGVDELDYACQQLLQGLENAGNVLLVNISFGYVAGNNLQKYYQFKNEKANLVSSSVPLLTSLGLLREHNCQLKLRFSGFEKVHVIAYVVTSLGMEFVARCEGIGPDNVQ